MYIHIYLYIYICPLDPDDTSSFSASIGIRRDICVYLYAYVVNLRYLPKTLSFS